jgi:hypothetical protein
VYDQI